ncbi:TetR/AcrR family transcriptional regulator [Sanguibacter sp. HDW7]|uniref:TetR/AcrR family transcriptional regulator n=1 Tax=Sanguibacter sp. HDW7 TaxID=2714931 RepID=UPI00140E8DBC|nr:TetR/AcrR family transcriptional regulator [Sanguibacter sp. HDW7]QIK82305.1 TetR/AcrR family transcriptional regulator [Sanguibacter sp. HDW7]
MTTGGLVDEQTGAPSPVEAALTEAIATSPRRARTREKLLDAALSLFAEAGIATTSIEAICERAGFTRGAFYSNFADKAELLDTLATREQDEVIAQLRAAITAVAGPCTRDDENDVNAIGEIASTLLNSLTFDRRRAIVNSEMRVLAIRDQALAESYRAREELLLGAIGEELTRLIEATGQELLIPVRMFVRLLWAGFQHDLESVERSGPDSPSATELASEWMTVVTSRLTQPATTPHDA